MVETNSENQSQAVLSQALLGGGSPKSVYVFFILSLCRDYFNGIGTEDPAILDARTAALISFAPNDEVRDRLWTDYNRLRDENNTLSASVKCVGGLVSYLSKTLEWEETSSGGYL